MTDADDKVIADALNDYLDMLTDDLHDWDPDLYESLGEEVAEWNSAVDYINRLLEAYRHLDEATADGWVRYMIHYPRR